ncbi:MULTISPECIES: glycosyltransferase [Micromonospora]|jgi:D-inositol-3-phosphate glycosyltransferase|uniref:Glycosyl transferase family 1 n=1 Tax=Micromonospora sicca TaxID=2202420 RepID=A0A317DM23_9ACTN|nr:MULTISPECIES: glycosyltransferase [unclassified Micromonospora]MBM0228984.1 glycosyltransferase [Micromonospora sp. ATA51]MDZ5444849.1 glycosyltransferase [Micromonospora sp. 4G57]MDZ5491249.1 glycosyltransferase [Micromonospora sp. 4G53]PWR15691.1 glycosyl transferase family 1 [Micromonospora sp. 4G51]
MRVGLVCAHAGPSRQVDGPTVGTHQHIARVAAELADRGHDVRVYERRDSAGQPERVEVDGYRLERVPVGPPIPLPTAALVPHVAEYGRWLAERWSGDWTPDVVHGHYWVGGLAAAHGVRETDIPVVQTFHSLGVEQLRHLGGQYDGPGERIPLERALTRAVDIAVAQCNDEVDELTRMGLQRTSVAMVPTGVDTGQFHPDGEAAPRDQRARILSVGGLSPGHGQEDLVRAMRLVGDAELVIAGGPPAEQLADHAEARRLRELAERTGVADQVKLVGAVPHDQMATWYRSADVVACTPHYSSAGRVSLEAMACGVPVVGYAMGGIADAVVDEVTGKLVPPGDVRALGVTLRRLLADNAGRFAYGHAAVDRVRCSYTWERTAGALERLYERVIGRRKPVEKPAEKPVEKPVEAA